MGRRKKPLPEEFRQAGQEALDILLAVMRDDTARNADRIKCAEIILDRGYGKPRQSVDLAPRENEACGVVILPARMDDEEVIA